jgi:hypothetical protein
MRAGENWLNRESLPLLDIVSPWEIVDEEF